MTRNGRPVIHVVDDDASFRASVGELLTAFDYRVALYESAAKLLEKPPADEPGCILLDLQMSGLDGLQLQDELHSRQIRLPVVFVTGHGDIPASVRAIKAGAEDFLTKPVPKDALFAAIHRALERYRQVQESDHRTAALKALVSQLTRREYEIFQMLVRGKLNKQIAHELGTTERTVKFHRQNLMQKCNVTTLARLVLIAERLRLL